MSSLKQELLLISKIEKGSTLELSSKSIVQRKTWFSSVIRRFKGESHIYVGDFIKKHLQEARNILDINQIPLTFDNQSDIVPSADPSGPSAGSSDNISEEDFSKALSGALGFIESYKEDYPEYILEFQKYLHDLYEKYFSQVIGIPLQKDTLPSHENEITQFPQEEHIESSLENHPIKKDIITSGKPVVDSQQQPHVESLVIPAIIEPKITLESTEPLIVPETIEPKITSEPTEPLVIPEPIDPKLTLQIKPHLPRIVSESISALSIAQMMPIPSVISSPSSSKTPPKEQNSLSNLHVIYPSIISSKDNRFPVSSKKTNLVEIIYQNNKHTQGFHSTFHNAIRNNTQ